MDLITDIVRDFVNRSREELALLDHGLADWRAAPDDPKKLTFLAEIPHNLREMAGLLGFPEIERVFQNGYQLLLAAHQQWPEPGVQQLDEFLDVIRESQRLLLDMESRSQVKPLSNAAPRAAARSRKRLVPACALPAPEPHQPLRVPANSLTDFIVENLADEDEQASQASHQMGERIVRLIDEVMTARHQIRQIFAHAVSLASQRERSEFLNQACASCPELQSSLERLLRSESQSQRLLQFPASELIRALLESLRQEETPPAPKAPPMSLTIPDSSAFGEDVESTVHVRPSNAFVTAATVAAVADPSGMPRPFGRYTLERELGRGAMGTVYLASDRLLNREVALKLLRVKPDDGPELVERFYREARSMASLQHANLCPIYDFGEVDGQPYLTMAFIKGRPLSEYLVDGRPLVTRYAVTLARTLATGLHQAHQMGIVHRDLKPANVMINPQGEPILMDFGLARRQRPGEVEITQQGMILGSPAYMSPEQVEGKIDQLGPPTDVHALGVILYELASGHKPFDGSVASVLAQIHSKEAAPLIVPEDPTNRLDAICRKAMAKVISQRFTTALDFANALGDYLEGTDQCHLTPEADSTRNAEPVKHELTADAVLRTTLTRLAKIPPKSNEQRWRWAAVTAALIGITAMTISLIARNSAESAPPQAGSSNVHSQ